MKTSKGTDWREVRRRRAWELKPQGWKQRDIAAALGVTEGAVSQWLKQAREHGAQRLAARKASGRPPRLTAAQRQPIPQLLSKGAGAFGFRGDLWTRRRVATVLQREFDVKHSLPHVGTLLRQCGWSRQKPVRRAPQRDEAAIASLVFQPRRNAIRPPTSETTGFGVTVSDQIAPPVTDSITTVIGATVQAAFRPLAVQPRSNAILPGTSEATVFLVTVSDGVAPALFNLGTRVTTTSVNDAPTICDTVANQTMNDNQSKAVFNTMTVADPDSQALLARVTIVDGTNRGNLTPASTAGWIRLVVGKDIVYNRYFSPDANNGATVQAAIRALVFQPRNNVPVGTQETTMFTVFINDGIANVTDNTTSVITTSVAPRIANSFFAVPQPFLDKEITTVVLPTVRKASSNPLARLLKKSR